MTNKWWGRWFLGRGRSTRTMWWMVTVLCALGPLLVFGGLTILVWVAGGVVPESIHPRSFPKMNEDHAMTLFMFIYLLTLWIPLSFGVRRMHDMSLSGWWYLGALGLVVALMLLNEDLGGLVGIAFALFLGFAPGTKGPNDFGPDPRIRANKRDVAETVPAADGQSAS